MNEMTTDCRPGRQRAGITFGTVMWFAIVAGLLEAVILLIRRFVFIRLTWSTIEVAWMAPVSNVCLLAVPALLLAAWSWWRPAPMGRGLPAVLTGLSVAGLLIVLGNGALHWVAITLLAVGSAVQVYRVLGGRRSAFERLVSRTTPVLAAVVVLMAAGFTLERTLSERRAIAATPSGTGQPNVLLIILDTVRAASLSLYGYPRPTTPGLERRAADWVVFDRAFAPAPWTLPSHGSVFTGHWPHDLSRGWVSPLEINQPTITEVLRSKGYVTAGFAANYFYTTRESGFVRGFMHYEDLPMDPVQVLRSSILGQILSQLVRSHTYSYDPVRVTREKPAGEIVDDFLHWLPARRGRPFFAFLNIFDAHRPFSPPSPYSEMLTGARRSMDRYDQEILYIDAQLDRLLSTLEKQGLLQNTLVVIAGDHGELLGEHGSHGHGSSLFRRVLQVPLLVRFGNRIPAGLRVPRPVTTRDIPATILDLLGVTDTILEGHSLAATWLNEGSVYPDTLIAELEGSSDPTLGLATYGPMIAVIGGGYQYIRRGDGEERLYDVMGDPLEIWNLRDSTDLQPVLQRLRQKAASLIALRAARETRRGGAGSAQEHE